MERIVRKERPKGSLSLLKDDSREGKITLQTDIRCKTLNLNCIMNINQRRPFFTADMHAYLYIAMSILVVGIAGRCKEQDDDNGGDFVPREGARAHLCITVQ